MQGKIKENVMKDDCQRIEKKIIENIPDNVQVHMIEQGGFDIPVEDVYIEKDDNCQDVLYVSH